MKQNQYSVLITFESSVLHSDEEIETAFQYLLKKNRIRAVQILSIPSRVTFPEEQEHTA